MLFLSYYIDWLIIVQLIHNIALHCITYHVLQICVQTPAAHNECIYTHPQYKEHATVGNMESVNCVSQEDFFPALFAISCRVTSHLRRIDLHS